MALLAKRFHGHCLTIDIDIEKAEEEYNFHLILSVLMDFGI